MVYLDNASTTPIDPEVLEAMMPFLLGQYGNAGTLYELGRNAKTAIETARKQVADLLGADPHQIVFTSGGTESNNLVLSSAHNYLRQKQRTHIISDFSEHDSIIKTINKLCDTYECDATLVGVDKFGCVNPTDILSAIRDDTGIVSVMHTNNETGSENDVYSISKLCSERNVLFHTDCVQAAGSCKLDVREIGCDYLSISSHKLHGMKGVGALYIKKPEDNVPLIVGGSNQEFGLRGGTENVAGIVGFGKACEITRKHLHEIDVHTSVLKQSFFSALSRALKEYGLEDVLHLNGEPIIKHGKILNVRFDGVDGETLLLLLDRHGICVSAGSACRSNYSEPSHVLKAMGINDDDARNSIRISFSKMNTEIEVIESAKTIAECVKSLRQI